MHMMQWPGDGDAGKFKWGKKQNMDRKNMSCDFMYGVNKEHKLGTNNNWKMHGEEASVSI